MHKSECRKLKRDRRLNERERENTKLLLRLKFIVNAIKLPLFLLPFTQKHLLFRLLAESTSSIVTLPLGSLWRCSAFSMLDCYCWAGWSRSEGVRAHDIETTTMGCKNFAFRPSAVVVSSARAIMSHSLHNDEQAAAKKKWKIIKLTIIKYENENLLSTHIFLIIITKWASTCVNFTRAADDDFTHSLATSTRYSWWLAWLTRRCVAPFSVLKRTWKVVNRVIARIIKLCYFLCSQNGNGMENNNKEEKSDENEVWMNSNCRVNFPLFRSKIMNFSTSNFDW